MGTLYIVSTPIGNLEDITIRAIKTLFSVDVIACEDTRRTGLLLSELKKRFSDVINFNYSSSDLPLKLERVEKYPKKFSTSFDSARRASSNPQQVLISYYDQVESQKVPELTQLLESGKNIALVSDSGTPLINDPGYLLVKEARKRGMLVISVPGPSALLAALTSCGLPLNNITFLGYSPEKSTHQLKLLWSLLQINRFIYSTYVFYSAPHKLETTLQNMLTVLGDTEITIARELTKVHEQVWQGKISAAITSITAFKGELVLLFNIPQA